MSAYARPRDLAHALRLRAEHPHRVLLAGGTDLMVARRAECARRGVIDLGDLAELGGVDAEGDAVVIGAGTTLAAIEAHPRVRRNLPLLAAAAREFAAPPIRHRATLGGNVVTCSPVGDTWPVLLALDAEVEVASVRGARRVPAAAFVTGYRATDLAADELLVAVRFPLSAPPRAWYWRKVGSRRAQGIAKVSLAAAAAFDGEGRITAPRVAMGAVADRPRRLGAVESLLDGARPGASLAAAAASVARGEITPLDDLRSTALYRSTVAGNLVASFVRSLPHPPT